MTSLILLACIYALWRMPAARKYTMLHILGAILMAGALGNFFDRIRLDYVVDFIYISLIDFPIFNVADIYVTFVCAAGLCLAFFGHFEEKDFDFLKRRKPDSKRKHNGKPDTGNNRFISISDYRRTGRRKESISALQR